MKYVFTALMAAVALILLAAPATADWAPIRDSSGRITNHKMHFPQLPDPTGWDVKFSPFLDPTGLGIKVVADDWQCSATGPVSDIHFWFSARGDLWNPGILLNNVHASIWSNDPGIPGEVPSMPKDLLWWGDSAAGDFRFKVNPTPGSGNEAWYDPNLRFDPPQNPIPNDHKRFWQMNITNIRKPFVQQKDEIYWLDLYLVPPAADGIEGELGWKTADTDQYPGQNAGKHFMDDAVYGHLAPVVAPDGTTIPLVTWLGPLEDLTDPLNPRSLDMAFVITPEPGTLAMLLGAGAIGIVGLLRRRRSRKP